MIMQSDTIKLLYDYNYWANTRLWQAVEDLNEVQLNMDMPNGIGSIRVTLVHMLSAEWLWRSRWQGDMPTTMLHPEDFSTLQAIRTRWQAEEQHIRQFLTTLHDDELGRELRYIGTMIRGEVFTLPLWKTMMHLINHQTQHRSEIAMRLTELSHSPGEIGMNVFFNR